MQWHEHQVTRLTGGHLGGWLLQESAPAQVSRDTDATSSWSGSCQCFSPKWSRCSLFCATGVSCFKFKMIANVLCLRVRDAVQLVNYMLMICRTPFTPEICSNFPGNVFHEPLQRAVPSSVWSSERWVPVCINWWEWLMSWWVEATLLKEGRGGAKKPMTWVWESWTFSSCDLYTVGHFFRTNPELAGDTRS